MPNAVCDTGHGATITLSSSGHSFNFTNIDLGEETIEDVSKDHLLSAGNKQYMPGDLVEPGEVSIGYQFDNQATQPQKGVVETLTITFPLAAGQTTPATWVGSGYIKRVKRPNLQTNVLQDGEFVFKFDGTTGPTFTPGT